MDCDVIVRIASFIDIAQIAKVHIQSWLETYPGIMPQRKLDSLNHESSERNWARTMESGGVFLVAEVEAEVVGFISGGENRSNEGCETGAGDACECELAAMYILREHHGKGVGKALYAAFTDRMVSLGYTSMVAWVAERNPACGFYARMGGERIDRRIINVMDTPVPVVAYRYAIGSGNRIE